MLPSWGGLCLPCCPRSQGNLGSGCPCRALLAVCLLAAGARADEAADKTSLEAAKSVYLPTTTNDYSSMIYSLLQEQGSRIAGKEGAAVSLPALCRASSSHSLHAAYLRCLTCP